MHDDARSTFVFQPVAWPKSMRTRRQLDSDALALARSGRIKHRIEPFRASGLSLSLDSSLHIGALRLEQDPRMSFFPLNTKLFTPPKLILFNPLHHVRVHHC